MTSEEKEITLRLELNKYKYNIKQQIDNSIWDFVEEFEREYVDIYVRNPMAEIVEYSINNAVLKKTETYDFR
jgi:hypothetical protein